MNKDNICKYYSSLLLYKKLLFDGEISEQEFDKIENRLAKKYCIKKVSLYRANDLINTPFRVMYIHGKKEVKSNETS